MGIIEELLLMAKNAIDEANQRGRNPSAAPMSAHTTEEVEVLRHLATNRVAQARAQHDQERQRHAAERTERERQHETQDRERQRQPHHRSEAAQVMHAVGAVDPQRIARLVRHPQALREMIVLREILDKPLALRRR